MWKNVGCSLFFRVDRRGTRRRRTDGQTRRKHTYSSGRVKRRHRMRFANGREAQVGDVFRLGDGTKGTVVCSIDGAQYSESYSEAQWSYLSQGILAENKSMGLVHFEEPEANMVFEYGLKEST